MSNHKAPGAHEQINVEQTIKDRVKIVRQNRKNMAHLNCTFEMDGKSFRVENLSAFGALLKSSEATVPKEVSGSFAINNFELDSVHMRFIRTNSHGDFYTHAFEIIGEPISMECVQSIEDVQMLIDTMNTKQEDSKSIPDIFARKIYEIKDWLEDLQIKINEFEKRANKNDLPLYQEYEDTFVQAMGEYFNQVMPIKNESLKGLLTNLSPEGIEKCYQFMREKLKDLIYQAPFSDRVFNKPLGYAGDYEMMNIIYQDNSLGRSLFAKCLHSYWVKQPAAQAVRNRAVYIQSKIEEMVQSRPGDNLHFLSVASGPSMEWQNLLKKGNLNQLPIRVSLLDQDESALVHAQKKIREISLQANPKIEFTYLHKAIRNVLARGLDEKYDMIYSAGLFDYFSDPVAQMAAQRLFDALKPGGRLIIGNFDISNPNSIIMDSALDWKLLYRSEEELKRLFSSLGGKVWVEQEKLNINIFCVIEKI